MYVCICACVIKVVVVHFFRTIIVSEVTSVVVLTGLFLRWTLCEFMINLRVAEWPDQPAAACAGSCDCVVVVMLLLLSMCICLQEAGAARGHIKQCCWTLLCVNVYTALTPQPIPSVFTPFTDPAHYGIRKYFKNSQSHTERYILRLG